MDSNVIVDIANDPAGDSGRLSTDPSSGPGHRRTIHSAHSARNDFLDLQISCGPVLGQCVKGTMTTRFGYQGPRDA